MKWHSGSSWTQEYLIYIGDSPNGGLSSVHRQKYTLANLVNKMQSVPPTSYNIQHPQEYQKILLNISGSRMI